MLEKDLKLKVFQPPVSRDCSAQFEEVYRFWDSVWTAANAEIGRETSVPSDMLTRQHEVLALYHLDRPIAVVCHRFVDFAADSTYQDSYFLPEIWHEEDKKRVREIGGFGLIGNQITIDPAYRKSASGLGTKYLITFLSLLRAQNLGVETVIAMLRSDKGLDRVFYEAGADPLVKLRHYREIVVDLVTFQPRVRPIRIADEYRVLVERLTRGAEVVGQLSEKELRRVA